MRASFFPFDVSDIDASIERESALRADARRTQTLRAKAWAQGFAEAARNPADAATWLEMFEDKS